MSRTQPARFRSWVALLVALAAGVCAVPARAQLVRLSLEELVDKADNVFVAECVEKQCEFRDGLIMTRYRLKVEENWKGQVKTDKDGTVELVEPGGTLNKPVPVTQFMLGMANMDKGEKVLLFTEKSEELARKAAGGETTRYPPDNPFIVGRYQGRFTVFKHPETGEKLVVNPGPAVVPGSIGRSFERQLSVLTEENVAKAVAEREAAKTAGTADASGDAAWRNRLAQRLLTRGGELAKRIEKRREADRRRVAQRSKADPKHAADIVQYEPLADVRARVAAMSQ